MTDKLQFLPEQAGYAGTHPDQVVGVQLDGGQSRLRADVLGAVSTVNANWILNRAQYSAFHRFWVQNTLQGSLPFLVDLLLDAPRPSQYKVQCVPGTYRVTRVAGLSHRVSMRLEVMQPEGFSISNHQFSTISVFRTELTLSPSYTELFLPGDQVGVYAFTETPVVATLDGVYTIATNEGTDAFTLSSPELVNPAWALLTTLSNVVLNAFIVKVDT